MTLPGSGAISFANIDAEIANGTNSIDMNWVRTNTKDSVTNLGALYSRAWYQQNTAGNCNNGNCTATACNCSGNTQCANCSLSAINCTNCDTRAWLQPNCNCACTYNCTLVANVLYNNCYSDERLKCKWERLPTDTLKRLAKVKVGTYERIDNGALEIGVSAQNLEDALPRVVTHDARGYKKVDYAKAALVSVIELVREVAELRKELDEIKSKTAR